MKECRGDRSIEISQRKQQSERERERFSTPPNPYLQVYITQMYISQVYITQMYITQVYILHVYITQVSITHPLITKNGLGEA